MGFNDSIIISDRSLLKSEYNFPKYLFSISFIDSSENNEYIISKFLIQGLSSVNIISLPESVTDILIFLRIVTESSSKLIMLLRL